MFLKSIYLRIVVFLALVSSAAGLWLESLSQIFLQNAIVNGLIVGVCILGIAILLRQFLQFLPELKWLAHLQGSSTKKAPIPVLLRPARDALQQSKGFLREAQKQHLIQTLEMHFMEQRDLGRYLVGITVFLGLLGTFWGLSQTLQAVSQVVMAMPSEASIGTQFLLQLKQGLASPLAGMGVAFSSSLFGLVTSLVLGYLELHVNQARTRFLSHVESWLNEAAKLPRGDVSSDGESVAMMQALLGQSLEVIEKLQDTVQASRMQHQGVQEQLARLADNMDRFMDQRFTEHNLLLKVAENLISFHETTQKFQQAIHENQFGIDDSTAQHIRNLDHATYRLVDAITQGQASLARELRNEIRILSRTMASIAEVEFTTEEQVAASAKEGRKKSA